MDERVIEYIIKGFNSREFQVFCYYFLNDIGYTSNVGPLAGPDGACDIRGIHEGREFCAHCTTMNETARQRRHKLTEDAITSSVKSANIFSEVVFCSVRSLGDLEDEENFCGKVLEKIAEKDSRYLGSKLKVSIFTAERISLRSAMLERGAAAVTMVANAARSQIQQVRDELGANEPRTEDYGTFKNCDPATFEAWIGDFSWQLGGSRQGDLMIDILEHIWGAIILSPRNFGLIQREIPLVLQPLFSVAKQLSLDLIPPLDELVQLLDWLEKTKSTDSMGPERLIQAVDLFKIRLLRRILYESPRSFENLLGEGILTALLKSENRFWKIFWQDLSFRLSCKYVRLKAPFAAIINDHVAIPDSQMASSSFALVRPFIERPLEISRNLKIDDVVRKLGDIASACESALEARWTVTALLRILPLYAEEEGGSANDAINTLIGRIPRLLVDSSSLLTLWSLRQWILNFLERRDVSDLVAFEKQFTSRRVYLYQRDSSYLQLEYAVALELVCRSAPELLDSIEFGRLLRYSQDPLNHSLLRNERLARSRALMELPKSGDQRSTHRWVVAYATSLFSQFAEREIKRNPAAVSRFRNAAKIYQIGNKINKIVTEFIVAFAESALASEAATCALLMVATRYMHRGQHTAVLSRLGLKALEAEELQVKRAAPDLAAIAYSCYYYGASADEKAAGLEIGRRLVDRCAVGVGAPSTFWSYCACVTFKDRPVEGDYVKAILLATAKSLPSVLDIDPKVVAIVSNHLLQATKDFAGQGSLFAKVLASNFQDAEAWNIFGTTMALTGDINSPETWERVAVLYRYGYLFSEVGSGTKTKCGFNYIFAMSKWYLLNNVAGWEIGTFVDSALIFLAANHNQRFAYKSERSMPFVNLITSKKGSLPRAIQDAVDRLCSRHAWFGEIYRSTV